MTNATKIVLDIKQILKILPHRYPFLLVDRVVEINQETQSIVAQKNVSFNESFFQGHFPELPVMPGVLILEALAQASGVYLGHLQLIQPNKVMVLLSMNEVKFRHPVRPGDILMLHSQIVQVGSRGGRAVTSARVQDKIVTEAQISFALADPQQL